MLSGSDNCPGHIDRTLKGQRTKKYKIDNHVLRKLRSSARYLVKESDNRILFMSLTFPQFKKKVPYNEINKYFSKFVENLRTNYHCGGYIAVREFGKKTHRVHFHLCISIPYIKFSTLNDSWCNCIKDICAYSKNALTSDKKTLFITDPLRAVNYICKYFSKAKGQISSTRLVFISNNVLISSKQYQGSIESLLLGYKGIYIHQTSDYTTAYRITDTNDFRRFCNDFLYPFFELSVKKQQSLYSYPDIKAAPA